MHSRWREAAAVPTEGRTQRTARQLCCPHVPLSCFPRPYPSWPSHRKPRHTRREEGDKGPPLPVLGFLGCHISMGPLRSHWSKWSQRHAQLQGRLGRPEINFSPVSPAKALGDTSRVQLGSVGGILSIPSGKWPWVPSQNSPSDCWSLSPAGARFHSDHSLKWRHISP